MEEDLGAGVGREEGYDANGDRIHEPMDGQMQESEPKVMRYHFRNYLPLTPAIREVSRLPEKFALDLKEQETVESVAKSLVAEYKGILEKTLAQVDITSLAPRRVNWDLKRDVEKKMKKLDRQTKRAIADLIRQRLMAEQSLGK